MFRNIATKFVEKSALKEADEYLAYLKSGTDEEHGMSLASTGLAYHFLTTTPLFNYSFPEELFFGRAGIDKQARDNLAMFNLEVKGVRKKLMAIDSQRYTPILSGLVVFTFSFRALLHSNVFASGRQIWAELLRGRDHYDDAMRYLRPDFTSLDYEQLWLTPNILAPK